MSFQPGKGWRRVVPSPKPLEIIETPVIKKLVRHNVVIAVGAGGIPVYKERQRLVSAEAVIDKDLASACLAKSLKAKLFLNITNVPGRRKTICRVK